MAINPNAPVVSALASSRSSPSRFALRQSSILGNAALTHTAPPRVLEPRRKEEATDYAIRVHRGQRVSVIGSSEGDAWVIVTPSPPSSRAPSPHRHLSTSGSVCSTPPQPVLFRQQAPWRSALLPGPQRTQTPRTVHRWSSAPPGFKLALAPTQVRARGIDQCSTPGSSQPLSDAASTQPTVSPLASPGVLARLAYAAPERTSSWGYTNTQWVAPSPGAIGRTLFANVALTPGIEEWLGPSAHHDHNEPALDSVLDSAPTELVCSPPRNVTMLPKKGTGERMTHIQGSNVNVSTLMHEPAEADSHVHAGHTRTTETSHSSLSNQSGQGVHGQWTQANAPAQFITAWQSGTPALQPRHLAKSNSLPAIPTCSRNPHNLELFKVWKDRLNPQLSIVRGEQTSTLPIAEEMLPSVATPVSVVTSRCDSHREYWSARSSHCDSHREYWSARYVRSENMENPTLARVESHMPMASLSSTTDFRMPRETRTDRQPHAERFDLQSHGSGSPSRNSSAIADHATETHGSHHFASDDFGSKCRFQVSAEGAKAASGPREGGVGTLIRAASEPRRLPQLPSNSIASKSQPLICTYGNRSSWPYVGASYRSASFDSQSSLRLSLGGDALSRSSPAITFGDLPMAAPTHGLQDAVLTTGVVCEGAVVALNTVAQDGHFSTSAQTAFEPHFPTHLPILERGDGAKYRVESGAHSSPPRISKIYSSTSPRDYLRHSETSKQTQGGMEPGSSFDESVGELRRQTAHGDRSKFVMSRFDTSPRDYLNHSKIGEQTQGAWGTTRTESSSTMERFEDGGYRGALYPFISMRGYSGANELAWPAHAPQLHARMPEEANKRVGEHTQCRSLKKTFSHYSCASPRDALLDKLDSEVLDPGQRGGTSRMNHTLSNKSLDVPYTKAANEFKASDRFPRAREPQPQETYCCSGDGRKLGSSDIQRNPWASQYFCTSPRDALMHSQFLQQLHSQYSDRVNNSNPFFGDEGDRGPDFSGATFGSYKTDVVLSRPASEPSLQLSATISSDTSAYTLCQFPSTSLHSPRRLPAVGDALIASCPAIPFGVEERAPFTSKLLDESVPSLLASSVGGFGIEANQNATNQSCGAIDLEDESLPDLFGQILDHELALMDTAIFNFNPWQIRNDGMQLHEQSSPRPSTPIRAHNDRSPSEGHADSPSRSDAEDIQIVHHDKEIAELCRGSNLRHPMIFVAIASDSDSVLGDAAESGVVANCLTQRTMPLTWIPVLDAFSAEDGDVQPTMSNQVWICCLSLNQTRAWASNQERQHLPYETFRSTRLSSIQDALNSKRHWCIFDCQLDDSLRSNECSGKQELPRQDVSSPPEASNRKQLLEVARSLAMRMEDTGTHQHQLQEGARNLALEDKETEEKAATTPDQELPLQGVGNFPEASHRKQLLEVARSLAMRMEDTGTHQHQLQEGARNSALEEKETEEKGATKTDQELLVEQAEQEQQLREEMTAANCAESEIQEELENMRLQHQFKQQELTLEQQSQFEMLTLSALPRQQFEGSLHELRKHLQNVLASQSQQQLQQRKQQFQGQLSSEAQTDFKYLGDQVWLEREELSLGDTSQFDLFAEQRQPQLRFKSYLLKAQKQLQDVLVLHFQQQQQQWQLREEMAIAKLPEAEIQQQLDNVVRQHRLRNQALALEEQAQIRKLADQSQPMHQIEDYVLELQKHLQEMLALSMQEQQDQRQLREELTLASLPEWQIEQELESLRRQHEHKRGEVVAEQQLHVEMLAAESDSDQQLKSWFLKLREQFQEMLALHAQHELAIACVPSSASQEELQDLVSLHRRKQEELAAEHQLQMEIEMEERMSRKQQPSHPLKHERNQIEMQALLSRQLQHEQDLQEKLVSTSESEIHRVLEELHCQHQLGQEELAMQQLAQVHMLTVQSELQEMPLVENCLHELWNERLQGMLALQAQRYQDENVETPQHRTKVQHQRKHVGERLQELQKHQQEDMVSLQSEQSRAQQQLREELSAASMPESDIRSELNQLVQRQSHVRQKLATQHELQLAVAVDHAEDELERLDVLLQEPQIDISMPKQESVGEPEFPNRLTSTLVSECARPDSEQYSGADQVPGKEQQSQQRAALDQVEQERVYLDGQQEQSTLEHSSPPQQHFENFVNELQNPRHDMRSQEGESQIGTMALQLQPQKQFTNCLQELRKQLQEMLVLHSQQLKQQQQLRNEPSIRILPEADVQNQVQRLALQHHLAKEALAAQQQSRFGVLIDEFQTQQQIKGEFLELQKQLQNIIELHSRQQQQQQQLREDLSIASLPQSKIEQELESLTREHKHKLEELATEQQLYMEVLIKRSQPQQQQQQLKAYLHELRQQLQEMLALQTQQMQQQQELREEFAAEHIPELFDKELERLDSQNHREQEELAANQQVRLEMVGIQLQQEQQLKQNLFECEGQQGQQQAAAEVILAVQSQQQQEETLLRKELVVANTPESEIQDKLENLIQDHQQRREDLVAKKWLHADTLSTEPEQPQFAMASIHHTAKEAEEVNNSQTSDHLSDAPKQQQPQAKIEALRRECVSARLANVLASECNEEECTKAFHIGYLQEKKATEMIEMERQAEFTQTLQVEEDRVALQQVTWLDKAKRLRDFVAAGYRSQEKLQSELRLAEEQAAIEENPCRKEGSTADKERQVEPVTLDELVSPSFVEESGSHIAQSSWKDDASSAKVIGHPSSNAHVEELIKALQIEIEEQSAALREWKSSQSKLLQANHDQLQSFRSECAQQATTNKKLIENYQEAATEAFQSGFLHEKIECAQLEQEVQAELSQACTKAEAEIMEQQQRWLEKAQKLRDFVADGYSGQQELQSELHVAEESVALEEARQTPKGFSAA